MNKVFIPSYDRKHQKKEDDKVIGLVNLDHVIEFEIMQDEWAAENNFFGAARFENGRIKRVTTFFPSQESAFLHLASSVLKLKVILPEIKEEAKQDA